MATTNASSSAATAAASAKRPRNWDLGGPARSPDRGADPNRQADDAASGDGGDGEDDDDAAGRKRWRNQPHGAGEPTGFGKRSRHSP